jgi:GAF domain-containing protein
MPESRNREALLIVAILASTVAVFSFDLAIELGVAGGVPYVGVVCLAYWARHRRWIWIVAAGCGALTVAGYYLSPSGGEGWKVLFNRGLALFAIGVTATLCDAAIRTHQKLQRSEHELALRVVERTAELTRTAAELEFAFVGAQGEAEGQNGKSAIIRETGVELRDIESFDEVLDAWARQAQHLIGAHQSAVSYFPHGNTAEGQHAIALSDKYEKYRTYDVLPTGEGIWRLVIGEKLSFCLTDEQLKSHPAWKNFSDMRDERGLEHPPMRGWLAVPILGREHEFIGLLQLSDKYEEDFTQDDLRRLTRLAQLMSPSFSLQYANERLQRRNEELSVAKDALEQSNVELQQFAYVASHDLQTPLRGIAGFAQLLQSDYQGRIDEKADEYLARIVDGAKRMQTLINDLLAYSRVESRSAPFIATDLAEVFADTDALLRTSIEDARGEVACGELPTVNGDRSQLSQLFQNLIGNSIKYHGNNPPRVHVSAERKEGQWTIAMASASTRNITRRSSRFSAACTLRTNTLARVSGWRFAAASSSGTEATFG